MQDFELKKRVEKLDKLNKEDCIKMIWMWSKQVVITLKQFRHLLAYYCQRFGNM